MLVYFYLNNDGQIQKISDTKDTFIDAFEIAMDLSGKLDIFSEPIDPDAGIAKEPDAQNNLINVQTVIASQEFLLKFLRAKRDKLLKDTIWIAERHNSQPDSAKTLTAEQYATWQIYWQALRDLPNTANLEGVDRTTIDNLFPKQP
jgi:hypothetical protein